jgi:ribosomal protein RSM22 (predicted rRNA methylase)
MEKAFSAPLSDLVVLSYSIGETDESSWPDLCKRLWGTTNKALVIIEPGTPKGYGRLMKLRSMMLSLGAYLWAPCPHSLPCPLERGDWCHFPARVARSSLHRKLKSADLGYEDEKFSYLVFGKRPIISYKARVIRKPLLHSGWLECITCQESGVKKEVFSKKEGEEYKKKKKLEWGDNF